MLLPKVSVVTVCYNAGPFVERTLKSVIGQTYPNLEYIVIDGGSTDNTPDIIKYYSQHIDYWISEPDRSHFDAMNKGLQHCTGDYVLFMHAGDRIRSPDSLTNIMAGARDADLIYARAVYIDEQGATRPWHKKTPAPEVLSQQSFRNGMVICHHSMVVRRTLVPPFRLAPWTVSNDIEWAIRLMENVRTKHFHDDIFCLYLAGGISHRKRLTAVLERFDICRRHFGLWPTVAEQFRIVYQAILRKSIS